MNVDQLTTHHHDDRSADRATSRWVLPLVVALVVVLVIRLTVEGSYQVLVREGMRWWLIAAAVTLAAVVVVAVHARRHDDHDHAHAQHADDDVHGSHAHGLRPGIYLLVPVLLALLVAPRPLGSFAAGRSNVVPSPTSPFSALDETGGAPELTLLEFNQRALDRDGRTLLGHSVTLVGFVVQGEPLRIARFRVACCAADGQAAMVRLSGATRLPAADRWVQVTGTFSGSVDDLPTLTVDRIDEISQPNDPYEAG